MQLSRAINAGNAIKYHYSAEDTQITRQAANIVWKDISHHNWFRFLQKLEKGNAQKSCF